MASTNQLIAELDAEKRRGKNRQMKIAAKVEQTMGYAGCVGGGALAGVVSGKFGDKKIAGVGLGMVGGFAALAVGVAGWGGKTSGIIGSAGAGALAFEIGKLAEQRMAKSGQTAGVGARSQLPRPATVADLRRHHSRVAA